MGRTSNGSAVPGPRASRPTGPMVGAQARAQGHHVPPAAAVIAGDDVPVDGSFTHRSALKRSGTASGCRGPGQHARWAPAVKELTNRSTPDSTRYPRPRTVPASYFNARPRVHADNGPGHPRAGPPRGSSAGCGRRRAGPSTLALLTVSFAEGRERTRAVAYYGAVAGVGASLGLLRG